ncbi:hypothetical protein LPB140_05960 [Sphingorhabdus lutea]|uniref:DUF1465 family protein n=2 Tax=Sphingorhabdus lutea TaxID=1913578 RepID=A0A1L3JET3_9SPHN|nr:hypothetical protein LPB140_05960 [Sphingorhabdus lutea]
MQQDINSSNHQIAKHQMTAKLVDSLYTEAMLLADEARSYFDQYRHSDDVPAFLSVSFSCESLKVTTRLMHVIAWLLNQKAYFAGEFETEKSAFNFAEKEKKNAPPHFDLGHAAPSDEAVIVQFPQEAQSIITSSIDLYNRLSRLSDQLAGAIVAENRPAPHLMVEKLRSSF